eukprot:CAMPEP_0198199494 /NCGR_PEP_ID=MMETSP1445-20131203/2789_1 /TAXON_ID=36898 /ORGANISM="Pyramimonas sp., Strain CCMP2087" /LENGTH=117 /DNA_ID=CAMNT_0043869357 /DNA_START=390 /DNA_END=743 /DNA_ORIENTATION=+
MNPEPFKKLDEDSLLTFLELVDLAREAMEVDLTLDPFDMTVQKFFRSLDVQNKGHVKFDELSDFFRNCGDTIKEDVSRSLMDELDTSLNGEKFSLVEMKSFFQAKFDEGGFDYTSDG